MLFKNVTLVTFFILFIFIIFLNANDKTLNIENHFPSLIIGIIACNRYEYLNQTLYSLFFHITRYEKDLNYNCIFFDQGTKERYKVTKEYNLQNTFFFNPSGMELSFNTLFSYIYSEYILMLEEDWVVEKNVENEIFYPSFIMESIMILSRVEEIYGVILRETHHFDIHQNLTIKTNMGYHILYVGILVSKYAYTNGASIYKTKNLKEVKTYNGEHRVSNFFLFKGYKVGFTYKGKKGKKDDILYQHVMDHIGFNTSRSSLCSLALY